MSLFRSKPAAAWAPVWRYTAPGLLWSMRFTGDGGIVLEIRDPAAQLATFACVDEVTGAERWGSIRLEEPWWVGIADVHDGLLFLHGYRKPDMPQQLGITAVDLTDGRIRWHDAGRTYQFSFDSRVYASVQRFEGPAWTVLDPVTGAVIDALPLDPAALQRMRDALNAEDRFADFIYPAAYDGTHPDRDMIEPVISRHVPRDRVRGPLDALLIEGLVLLSWHETGAHGAVATAPVDQHLLAADARDGRVVFRDRIATAAPMPTIDSFFVKDHRVYYIKERQTLTAHDLTA